MTAIQNCAAKGPTQLRVGAKDSTHLHELWSPARRELRCVIGPTTDEDAAQTGWQLTYQAFAVYRVGADLAHHFALGRR